MAEIWTRLTDGESNFVERKRSASSLDDLRKTLVAFANSVPPGEEAVLFVGVEDSGAVVGFEGTDSIQKKLEEYCRIGSYPPIKIRADVKTFDGKCVLAIIVPHSADRPHFSGPAYVRIGSQSVRANEEQYREFIAARSEVGAELLHHKGQVVTVVVNGKRLGDSKTMGRPYNATSECRILEVTPFDLRLEDLGSNRRVSEPIGNITLARDEEKFRLKIIVQER